jgi:predicted RNA-binding Zn-ribbon protein involved in translation (DUF1610 family)
MAQLKTYRCRCGFEAVTEPLGHYSLMSGEYYNFHCHKCRDVVAISAKEIAEAGYFLKCPDCGGEELECWSPNGKCPKCGTSGSFVELPGIMMAD